MTTIHTRRQFLTTVSLAGAAGLLGAPPSRAAEGALETTTVRLAKVPVICLAPQYVSEELLRAEGFTDIRYLDIPALDEAPAIGRGEVDFSTMEVNWLITHLDTGAPLVTLAGVHVGCYELFGQQNIRRISDLKGKRVAAAETPRCLA
jgi:NitT/TauT family transport system substrate-binding protein